MIEHRPEPRNPFYILLILVSLGFVVTALAYAIVPILEQKATDAGNPPPPSPFRDSLRSDGWLWLIYEGAAITILGLVSMGYDRLLRALKRSPSTATIPSQPAASAISAVDPPS